MRIGLVIVCALAFGCGPGDAPAAREGKGPAGVPSEKPAAGARPDLSTLHARLREKNSKYTGEGKWATDETGALIGDFAGAGAADLSPLAVHPFAALDLRGLPVTDLRPLAGMPLRMLGLEETKVRDLGPLRGLPIERLYLNDTRVDDLRPLAGMPLVELQLVRTDVEDLSPLRGAPLEQLWLNETQVQEIEALASCPLVSLTLHRTGVRDLTPLAGVKTLERLHIAETPVEDLGPIAGLALTRLIFTPDRIRFGLDAVRRMATLEEIGTTLEGRMAPDAFWKLLDEGKRKGE